MMKGLSLFLFALVTAVSAVSAQPLTKMMTYNIKLDYPMEGKHSWNQRKALMVGQIQYYEPEIFGVQEALPNQMKFLDSTLVDFKYIGVGRDNGRNLGEYSAIFFNHNTFEALENGTFWLSETPNRVSMGWDAVCNRICTYGRFKNKKTGQQFWVFNTHLDHVGAIAQEKSTKLIIEKISVLNKRKLPVVLMGDFNMTPENHSIQFILNYLNDSRSVVVTKPFGPLGTFNGFHFDRPVIRRIDYIFVSNHLKVKKYAVLSDNLDGNYPSDHLPILVTLSF